ncbi:PKD domain-containing protein [Chitinophaga sp. W2I13]|uniref:PKD domain-containing protein n=1 Tax=Chitinophaga sp. W2I13 TaxID=3373923 RepID=UPI003D1B5AB6
MAQQNADFSASATSDCESLITSFTDLSTGNPTAWLWDFGNGTTSTKKNPGATYVKTGKYTVSLKVTFGDGSTKTAVKTNYIAVRAKAVSKLQCVFRQRMRTVYDYVHG